MSKTTGLIRQALFKIKSHRPPQTDKSPHFYMGTEMISEDGKDVEVSMKYSVFEYSKDRSVHVPHEPMQVHRTYLVPISGEWNGVMQCDVELLRKYPITEVKPQNKENDSKQKTLEEANSFPSFRDRTETNAESNTVSTEEKPWEESERRDEELIEMMEKGAYPGDLIEDWFYDFKAGSRGRLQGISVIGVQAFFESKEVRVLEYEVQLVDDHWAVTVRIEANGSVRMGASMQSKMMKTRSGYSFDPFGLQKAINKAERNALQKLMSARDILDMRNIWEDTKK